MEMDRIAEPTPIQSDQNHSSPRAERHNRPIEVHCLILVGDVWGRELDSHPFGDEVGENLRLDSYLHQNLEEGLQELKSS